MGRESRRGTVTGVESERGTVKGGKRGMVDNGEGYG